MTQPLCRSEARLAAITGEFGASATHPSAASAKAQV
jgi:hypothetical protein